MWCQWFFIVLGLFSDIILTVNLTLNGCIHFILYFVDIKYCVFTLWGRFFKPYMRHVMRIQIHLDGRALKIMNLSHQVRNEFASQNSHVISVSKLNGCCRCCNGYLSTTSRLRNAWWTGLETPSEALWLIRVLQIMRIIMSNNRWLS